MWRRVAGLSAAFASFVALAVILTWPLASHITTALSDLGDPLLNAWIIDWDDHALLHDPLHLFAAPIFYPAKYPLAFSENLLGIALPMLPLHAAGLAPVTVLNIAMLLGFALTGFGVAVLARTMGRSPFASMIAGMLVAFCSFEFDHLAHIQIIWSGWLPLMFAALLAYWRTPTLFRAALLAAAFVMNGLTNIHWLLFGSVALSATIVLLATVRRRDSRFWLVLIAALGLAVVVLLPVLLPYDVVADLYGMRRVRPEVEGGSASWTDWFVASPRNWLWHLTPENDRPERHLFPGLTLTILSAIALLISKRRAGDHVEVGEMRRSLFLRFLDWIAVFFLIEAYVGALSPGFTAGLAGHTIVSLRDGSTPFTIAVGAILVRFVLRLPDALGGGDGSSLRHLIARSRFTPEEWCAILLVVIGVLGSLGTNSFFHAFLFEHVRVFAAIRVPARWAILAYIGLGMLAARGIDEMFASSSTRARLAYTLVLPLIGIFDVAPRIRWEQAITRPAPVYSWLRDERIRGPVLELPMSGWNYPFPYLLASTVHHVPLMNGTSGFEPPLHRKLREMTERGEYNDGLVAELQANRCHYVIVHPDWLQDQAGPALMWLGDNVRSGRLALVRRFDHDLNGDYVFAVTAVASDWKRLVRPDNHDGAGFTTAQNFGRLLQNAATYSSHTFGRIEEPRMHAEVHGNLHVRGWALSPFGVRRVTMLVHSGKYRFPVRYEPRFEVSSRWPWYPQVPQPGFIADLPKRPRGMPRLTDLQIEIVDGRGAVTLLPDVLLLWD